MPRKLERKPKLTDEERHKRFLEMARKVEASEKPEDFDKAFNKVTSGTPHRSRRKREAERSQQ